MSTQPEAKQVPLVERLESVPVGARLAVDDGPYSTSFYAVGAMAHEAAAELRRLHALNGGLLEVAKLALRMGVYGGVSPSTVEDAARAAIKAVEEGQ